MNDSNSNDRTIGGIPMKNFSKDFTDPQTRHDRIIVVEGQKFYVLTGHLSFCSEFFDTMFNSDFKEKNQHEIEIEDLSADDFHLFLQMLVLGNNSKITVSNCLTVAICAQRFLAPEVLYMCEQFVVAHLKSFDKIEMLKTAFEYDWSELKDKIANDLVGCLGMTGHCPGGCTNKAQIYCYGCRKGFILEQRNDNITSFYIANEAKLSDLPAEIHSFLFKTLLKKGKE